MQTNDLKELRKLFLKNKISVSKIEWTKGNYDHKGNLIKQSLPTITTNFCEIGIFNDEIYFVFIINPKTFNLEIFKFLKEKSNVKIYGFTDFNKTLFPAADFDLEKFMKQIIKDKYLQIQFDFKNIRATDLLKIYLDTVNILKKLKIKVINQQKIDLSK